MDRKTWETRVAEAEEWFTYHLGNSERGAEVGSRESAERSLHDAARWASILTALKGMEPVA